MKTLSVVFTCLTLAIPCSADIIYVKEGGTGSGTNWADPNGLLQIAINNANSNDEVWVAAGTYKPTIEVGGSGDRYKTFQMKNGVAIYGGFPDTGDPDMADRDPNQYDTILSGDIGVADEDSDNCYHVFYHPEGTDLDATAVLDGFTITAGNANGSGDHDDGGGMYNYLASPTLVNCTFTGNSANSKGGGMYNTDYSSSIVTNCTFTGNSASSGGGMYNYGASSPIVTNCTFTNNQEAAMYFAGWSSSIIEDCIFSNNSGGGIRAVFISGNISNCTFIGNTAGDGGAIWAGECDLDLTDCIFIGNSAGGDGGGVYTTLFTNLSNCKFIGNSASRGGGLWNKYVATFTNCIFISNTADEYGGGVCNYYYPGNPQFLEITQCTFANNDALNGNSVASYGENRSKLCTIQIDNSILWNGGDEIYNEAEFATITVRYTDIYDSYDGIGNINTNPLFVDADGPDNVPGTEDDNLRLSVGSPCIDAGDNSAVNVATDLGGNPRFHDDPAVIDTGNGTPPIVDMGAYEAMYTNQAPVADAGSDQTKTDTDDNGIEQVTLDGSGSYDLDGTIVSWTWTDNLGDTIPDGEVVIAILSVGVHTITLEVTDNEGAADIDTATVTVEPQPSVILLSPNGGEVLVAGSTETITWSSAGISDVLIEYSTNNGSAWTPVDPPNVGNIGSYNWTVPWVSSDQCLVQVSDASDPCTSDTSDARFTIRLGTIYVDDVTDPLEDGTAGHPFDAIQEGIDAAFDGDTVIVLEGTYTGTGNRDIDFGGKAIMVRSTDPENPVVVNATIIDCQNSGRGFYFHSGEGSESALNGLTIKNGSADNGGGIYCNASGPTVTNCTFDGNSASGYGGGIYNKDSSPTLDNCTLSGNLTQGHGGAMYCEDSSPDVVNCVFSGNIAEGDAGGLFNERSSPTLTNCTFSGNFAYDEGGGICTINNSSPTLTNCILWGDAAGNLGNEIYLSNYWGASSITVTYSDVEGDQGAVVVEPDCTLNWGDGNIDSDPPFVDADGPDDIVGTEDDDLRLLPGSPCIDAGDPCYIPDPCETDLDGNSRIINDIVDMGAYEYTGEGAFPDLEVTSEDITFGVLPGTPGQPNTIMATIWNVGTAPATDIVVVFSDFDGPIAEPNIIPLLNPGESKTVGIKYAWPEADFRLITVTVDTDDTESDNTNNSASKLYQIGWPADMSALLEVLWDSAPSGFTEGTTATINGQASYRILIQGWPDYVHPVIGGSVSLRISHEGTDANLPGPYTDTVGCFDMPFDVPGEAGDQFDVEITVYDGTLTGSWQGTFDVLPVIPPKDLWINSDDISFSLNGPDITIQAVVHTSSNNTEPVFDVPVTFSIYPPQSGQQIGETQYILQVLPGDSNSVSVTWLDAPDGIYRVEVKLGPGYSDDNNANNTATKPLANPEPEWIDVIIEDPCEGETIMANSATAVAVSVKDDNNHVLIPSAIDLLTLQITGADERQVNLKGYFDWDTLLYEYSWQLPTDANGPTCLEVTAESVDLLGSLTDTNSVCVNVFDDAPPTFSITTNPRWWARIGQVVQITVDSSEPLSGDDLDWITVVDNSANPIPFSPADPNHPTPTRWVYDTNSLPPETALGMATISVQGTDTQSNAGTGTGHFTVLGPPGEPLPDFWLYSEDITFSDDDPNLGDTITIWATIHADPDNDASGPYIPVTFYAQHPAGDYEIDDTQTDEIPADACDIVSVSWTNAAEGWYIIEVALEPDFSDRNYQNNRATRAITVGDQCFAEEDYDCDRVHNDDDNCPMIYNPDQNDLDSDGVGNVCDNCPADVNPNQADGDGDGVGDLCDNCLIDPNPEQLNTDGDNLGDACDDCPNDPDNDSDGDGFCGDVDNCPGDYNPSQTDSDGDGAGDVCDDDNDNDGVPDISDNCPLTPNPAQSDVDEDGVGDLCDLCPADALDECDPNGSVAEPIDPNEGGVIETPDGNLIIIIEPNDLDEPVTISITQIDPPDPDVDLMIGFNPGWGQAFAVYDLEPDGLVFIEPVTVTITVDVTELNQNQRNRLGLYQWNESANKFILIPDADCSVVEDAPGTFTKVCTVELDHFSIYAMILPTDWETRAYGDFTADRWIDMEDLFIMARDWLQSDSIADIAPLPTGDGTVDNWDFSIMAQYWLDLVYIPGGEFEMGRHVGDGNSDELPPHAVLLDAFFTSRFEITNQQYCDYLNSALGSGSIYLSSNMVYGTGNNQTYCDTSASSSYSQIVYSGGVFSVRTKPEVGGRDMSDDPMVRVSWYGAVAYCNWRSGQEGYQSCYDINDPNWSCDFLKEGYRLPTEAEWEYAARGGNHSPYYRFPWGEEINHDYANYRANGSAYSYDTSPYTTNTYHPDWNDGISPYTSVVGSFSPNGYGLYDMTGNVMDWCNDRYDSNYYNVSPYDNPQGPASSPDGSRVLRGGGWISNAHNCRVATRINYSPDYRFSYIGFRIVLDLN